MKPPDVEAALEPLKSFQRETVNHAFHRLFEAPDSTSRFLVADEVGLGKTLVARGIIARAIDHLWDRVRRIDIIYICSNGSIARSNLPKLQVGTARHHAVSIATRLTMLATQLASHGDTRGLDDGKLNFISLTPSTSFNMGNAAGRAIERIILFRLLNPIIERRIPLMNLLQGRISDKNRWRDWVISDDSPIEPTVAKRVEAEFESRDDLRNELNDVLNNWFKRFRRKGWPYEACRERNRVIGELRQLVARVCIDALEPDLVILDEFQRFKPLMEPNPARRSPAAQLAQSLFDAKTPEGEPVRTLLLSATPYKLYTADAEIEHEDHYRDFIDTTSFLMQHDPVRVDGLRREVARFGMALKRATDGDVSDVVESRDTVTQTLQTIMARTERVLASEAHDAMVEEPEVELTITPKDIRQYVTAHSIFRAVNARDPITYWKSAPYLLHFMHGYKFNGQLDEAINSSPQAIASLIQQHGDTVLHESDLHAWGELDPGNAKLRELAQDLLDGGLWRLLWMPPTVPYWPLAGAFEGQGGWTKTLLFSAWNVVPDVVSAVLSYEAERRMMDGQVSNYADPARQQVPQLRFSQSASGVRSRHRLMLLLLPSCKLADEAHPLNAPLDVDRRKWVRSRIKKILADSDAPNPTHGEVDTRWEWAALVVLDPSLREFVSNWRNDWSLPRPNPEVLPAYLDDLLAIDPSEMGRRPDGLVDLLTDVALGSPATVAARTLAPSRITNLERCRGALKVADAFWRIFNRPAVISLLRRLFSNDNKASPDDTFYWRLVLRYCVDGNLQAVLDESWHWLWEQNDWRQEQARAETAATCVDELSEVVHPSPSRVHANFFRPNGDNVEKSELRIRTVFALRFGDTNSEEREVSQDAVRAAFNSPFRPFVLTSTSIGQEGLDFHPWCHRIVHWDLPGNPVDLEQREGRVHRYKGHAVRKNVALAYKEQAIKLWRPGQDLWQIIFRLANDAARKSAVSDLIPYWIAHGDYKVQRYVPLLPYSREVEAFQRLKRQLAAYRVVFGQPRQEELMTLLDHSEIDTKQLAKWAIDLRPPVISPD